LEVLFVTGVSNCKDSESNGGGLGDIGDADHGDRRRHWNDLEFKSDSRRKPMTPEVEYRYSSRPRTFMCYIPLVSLFSFVRM
jgi:hypothetical protein